MLTATKSNNPIKQMTATARYLLTEMWFRAVMTTITQEDSVSFADKVSMAENYMQVCKWDYDKMRLQDALDWINPAYAGMTGFRTCGERFYRKEGQWVDFTNDTMKRLDIYLHVATQTTHTLEYVFYGKDSADNAVFLDADVADGYLWNGKVPSFNQLPEIGINQLLIKIGALPF